MTEDQIDRRVDNFRLVAAGGLPDVIEQVKQWHDGVRVGFANEDEAWDTIIRGAWDYPHKSRKNRWGTDVFCECHLCRPNRRFK